MPVAVQHLTCNADCVNLSGGGDQMPTVAEVCESFGLNDVQIEYSENDYQTLTTYKLFQQHVRPLLAKENPRVSSIMGKVY